MVNLCLDLLVFAVPLLFICCSFTVLPDNTGDV